MDFVTNLWNSLIDGFPNVVVAIIYLVIAFFVAWIAKLIVMAILKRTGAENLLKKTGVKDEKTGRSTTFVGKLVFLIVFLLFLPAVLNQLGMQSVASPITNVVSVIVAFLPNLLAAGIILFIGIYVAKIIRQLLQALLNRIGLNKLQSKLGVEAIENENSFASVVSGIVYVFILVPVIILVLQVLGLDAVSVPATTILTQIFGYLPSIFVAILLFVVGYYIAKLLAPLVESVLSSLGADKINEKIFPESKERKIGFSISHVVGQIVRYLILIIFLIQAVNLLQLELLTNIGIVILGYLPLAVSAIIILGGGLILANWLEKTIIKHSPKRKTVAMLSKFVIIILASFMTLSQLGFAQSIVNYAFIIVLSSLAIAFAVAFGIGGRAFASNRLSKLEQKLDEEAKPSSEDPS